MADARADGRQEIMAAIQRLEAGTGRGEFAPDQIAEEMARVGRAPEAGALRAALAAMDGDELEGTGDGLYRRSGGGEPAPASSRSDPGVN